MATRKLTSEYEQTGSLPPETPIFNDMLFGGFSVRARAMRGLTGLCRSAMSLVIAVWRMVSTFLTSMEVPGDSKRVATCLGFGPRFLHSTGQGYKGGPNTGVFLQITCDDAADLPVPGQKYTFGVVKAAQARGDFEVLAERGRRALRVHLGKDVGAGLRTLEAAIKQALT